MIKSCFHCGEDTRNVAEEFCCLGCDAAYKLINKIGFGSYYKLREIIPTERKIKPEDLDPIDISEFASVQKDGSYSATLMIQGLHCAACVWLIESILKRQTNVIVARINLSKKTLLLKWNGDFSVGNNLIKMIQEIGYKLLPFDVEVLNSEEKKHNDSILRAMAVAGFGAGNVMLISVSLWFSDVLDMGAGTRNLLHFFSSLIALPVIIYSSRPFVMSAIKSVRNGYPNMDLAISIAVFLACSVSLFQTFRGAEHVYFDSAVMLIFFLLIGRYLDLKVRKKAFAIASEFTMLSASFGRIEDGDNIKILPIRQLQVGMTLVVAVGEKIAADGLVIDGESAVDTSLITGESIPKNVGYNSEVYAGTINIMAPLRVRITKSANDSLLSEIITLSEEVENKKNKYVRISDFLARFYIPVVHIFAALTFFFWISFGWETALMNATAVLIITCPCALALAVPIIQTIAVSNFIKRGILIKSGEALEKIPNLDVFVFDKTGSLTLGELKLEDIFLIQGDDKILLSGNDRSEYLKFAASLAKSSNHPISKAVLVSFDGTLENITVQEEKGFGLKSEINGKLIRLGRKSFCEIKSDFENDGEMQRCFMKYGDDEILFLFKDEIKEDAKLLIAELKIAGKRVVLLSGDEKSVVENVAKEVLIDEFYFEKTPISKVQFLEKLEKEKKGFVMIGDGINDAPALCLADVSISFNRASDIAQNVADIVIQGKKLMPIIELLKSSRRATYLMKQNLAIALIYNLIAVPYAMSGYVIPLIAAIAMSSSSLLVLFNSLRMNKGV